MVIDLRQAFLSDRWERELAYEMDLSTFRKWNWTVSSRFVRR